eukprot:s6166_g2.t1
MGGSGEPEEEPGKGLPKAALTAEMTDAPPIFQGGFVEAQADEGGEPGKSDDETGAIVTVEKTEDSAEKRRMERETSEQSVSTASQMEKQISQASAASARSIISEGWRSTGMAAAALMGAGCPVEDVAPQQVRTSSSSSQLPYPSVLVEDID